jgi:Ser/Thr protein kinase RdoA (MazF antagonist)
MNLFATPAIVYFPRPGRLTAGVQSRLRSPDIDRTTVASILGEDYGLEITAPLENLPNTRRNRNLIVHTSGGKKVFKLYRHDWRPLTIDFEHSILQRLAALESPAPRLTAARDGRTWVERGGERFCLFEFIDGINYSSAFLLRAHRLALTALLGSILARIHHDLAGFQPAGRHHLGFADYAGARPRDVAWHATRVVELSAASAELIDPIDRGHAAWLVARGDSIVAEMARLDEQLTGAHLPRLVIHGDYGLHNLVVHALNRATPVDFELARIEWRLSDLASCLSKMRYASGAYDFEGMRWFMKGYRDVYPVDRDEWRWFPDALRYYRLMGAVGYWNSYFETNGPTRKLLSARDALEQADWGREHPREIDELGGF